VYHEENNNYETNGACPQEEKGSQKKIDRPEVQDKRQDALTRSGVQDL